MTPKTITRDAFRAAIETGIRETEQNQFTEPEMLAYVPFLRELAETATRTLIGKSGNSAGCGCPLMQIDPRAFDYGGSLTFAVSFDACFPPDVYSHNSRDTVEIV